MLGAAACVPPRGGLLDAQRRATGKPCAWLARRRRACAAACAALRRRARGAARLSRAGGPRRWTRRPDVRQRCSFRRTGAGGDCFRAACAASAMLRAMLREIGHFLRHAPATLKLQRELGQAGLYDVLTERADAAGLGAQRRALVSGLEGEVLEVGCGTGRMFSHYSADARVLGIEPDDDFLSRAAAHVGPAAATVTARPGDGMNLAYDENRFDAVVFGLVLCSVPSVERVLAEARRVLRPGGQLRLIEHVRSQRPIAGALMDAFNPVWLKLNGQGCNMNRDPCAAIERAGFGITEVAPFQIFSPGWPAFPVLRIHAS